MSAQLPCTHRLAPSWAGLLNNPGPGWRGWRLKAGEGPWLPGGPLPTTHPEALLRCLEQHLLETGLFASLGAGCGDGETHLWVSATARSGREGRISEMQEGRSGAIRPVFSVLPLANAGPYTVFSWASFCPQFPCLPGQGHALSLCDGDIGTAWGRVQTRPGSGARGGESCQAHSDTDPPEAVTAKQVPPVPAREA